MRYTGARNKNLGCWLGLLKLVLILVAIYLFRYEIIFFWQMIRPVPQVVLDATGVELATGTNVFYQLLFILYNLTFVVLFSSLIIYLIAGAVLPVRTLGERWQAMRRFTASMFGFRAPLLIVRGGKLVTKQLKKPKGGGIAIVDFDSAIVLGRRKTFWTRLKKLLKKIERLAARLKPVVDRFELLTGWLQPVFRWLKHLMDRLVRVSGEKTSRERQIKDSVRGYGITFLRKGQKLHGQISLTNQARAKDEILGVTDDGVEVKARISTVFSLGQPPSVITVAFVSLPNPENLWVLSVDPETQKITLISDDLEEADKQEIYTYAMAYLGLGNTREKVTLCPPDTKIEYPPYQVDEERVFSAVFARARPGAEGKLDDWTSFPLWEATRLFRDMISKETFDSLYLPDQLEKFPLQAEFKPAFKRRFCCRGILSYQFVQAKNGQPPAKDQELKSKWFRIAPVQRLAASAVMRDAGIKALHAGFAELTPTDPKMRRRWRPKSWSIPWQTDIDRFNAEQDREFLYLKNRASAERQLEMINTFSPLIRNPTSPVQIRLLSVFQALEEIAGQPPTRRLLLGETRQKLKTFHEYVSSGDGKSPGAPTGQTRPSTGGPTGQEPSGG